MSKQSKTNRFGCLKPDKDIDNKFLKKSSQSMNNRWERNSHSDDKPPLQINSRWKMDPPSPKNSFKRRNDNFDKRPYGKNTDRYGNYRGSRFRKETRPKTPPPKTFKMEETDFPPLG